MSKFKNIATCLGAKDLITYIFQSKVYINSDFKIYIITKSFSILILKFINIFYKINFIFINEKDLLKKIGINNFIFFLSEHNKLLIRKSGWYKQQILKYAIHTIICDDYLIIDSDTFPKDLNCLYKINTDTRFYNTYASLHMPYEEMFNRLFKVNIEPSKYNYVTEVYPIKFIILKDLLDKIEAINKDKWYIAILKNVETLYGFSEYQTFGKFQFLHNYTMVNTIYDTDRHYGKKQLSFQKVEYCLSDFFSFETYDYPKGLYYIFYLIIYKPYFLLVKLFNL